MAEANAAFASKPVDRTKLGFAVKSLMYAKGWAESVYAYVGIALCSPVRALTWWRCMQARRPHIQGARQLGRFVGQGDQRRKHCRRTVQIVAFFEAGDAPLQ